MFFHLVMKICLIGSPQVCKDESIRFEGQVPLPFECSRVGMVELAKWSEDHPTWVVNKFKCVSSDKLEVGS